MAITIRIADKNPLRKRMSGRFIAWKKHPLVDKINRYITKKT